ncbi:protein of unknown function (DUF397) [Prauserella flava]|nr:protein of unknown function (DUF397) [Prauserella flava]MCR3735575.1 protein of unknown function (DUF397) [Prauserella salsuginis]
MTDGVDPGTPSAGGPGGTAGPARAQQAKQDVSAALDLGSAAWTRLRDEAGIARGPVEYAFVRHTDGVTYVVLRSVPGGEGHSGEGHSGEGNAGDGHGGGGHHGAGQHGGAEQHGDRHGGGMGHDGGGQDGRRAAGDGHASHGQAVLVFTPSEWDAFLAGVRDGEFDRPPE